MTASPTWFDDALAVTCEERWVDAAGTAIRYLTWGEPHKPGLLLVHGGLAHAYWWRFLAPFFAENYFVVALELSGHGDSGWRERYAALKWVEEITGVAAAARFTGKPVLIGHSMGGLLSFLTAGMHPGAWRGLVIIDAPLDEPLARKSESEGGKSYRHIKPYPDLATGLTRFRLLPDQPCANRFIFNYLAETSLKRTDAGWVWKFDPTIFERLELGSFRSYASAVTCPAAFIRGEFSSIVGRDIGKFLARAMGRLIPVVEIPQAHHHVMLDQPLALIAALRAMLATWQLAD